MHKPRPWYALVADVVAVVALLLAYTPGFVMQSAVPLSGQGQAYSAPGWLPYAAWLLAALTALPILVHRRWPQTVLGIVLAASAAANVLLHFRWPYPAVALVLLALATRRRAVAWLALCLGVAAAARLLAAGLDLAPMPTETGAATVPDTAVQIGVDWLVLVAAWAIGTALRAQRQYAARAAEQAARQAVMEQRLEIARELHDILTHSIGMIAVKAGVANHVAQARPLEVPNALKEIEATSRSALAELRQVLGVLRTSPSEDADPAAHPGLATLPALVRRATDAGIHAQLSITGTAEISAGLQLSIYRIIQEALTNVVKHAAAARCRITVAITDAEVSIDVTDDGGHGLTGMRERVDMYGGSLSAGPRPGGGWGVHATLPLSP